MMKSVRQKIVLFYVALILVVLPTETFAAQKKVLHPTADTYKYAVTRTKSGTKLPTATSSKRIKVSIRKHRAAAHRVYADSQNFDSFAKVGYTSGVLQIASSKALIVNQDTGETIFAKGTNVLTPIASVTKLMTAMVMLDAKLPMNEVLTVTDEDVDYLKGSSSRLPVGTRLSRLEMLQLALMASENRAASALGRNYPGGKEAFVRLMNAKAIELGMTASHFADPTGLDSNNMSTAEDLVRMVKAAYQYIDIKRVTTTANYEVYLNSRGPVNFHNTNALVREGNWEIGLSKTGYISEAGRCLVMQATIAGQAMIIVLLDSNGKFTRIGDANRIRRWIENNPTPKQTVTGQLLVTKSS